MAVEGVQTTDRKYPGIAAGAELWSVDGKYWFVAYQVPNTNPPVWLTWGVESTDAMQRIVGEGKTPTADRTLTVDQYHKLGSLSMGITAEIANKEEHPFSELVTNYERLSMTQPWLRDSEVLALTAGAMLEGRTLTPPELQSTKWWRSRNASQRAWAQLVASDPKESVRRADEAKINTRQALEKAGVANPSGDLVHFLASRLVTGDWSEAKVQDQILALSDPFSGRKIDKQITSLMRDKKFKVDTTRAKEEEVRGEVLRWLGPVHGAWSERQISEWAGKVRNDPDGAVKLTDLLRGQRMALFPEYEQPNLTYEDIAGPWRGLFNQVWGQEADELDPLFSKVVRLNDADEASKLLRREGLNRGVGQVVNTMTQAVGQAFGGTERKAL